MLCLDDPKFDRFENRSTLEDQLIPLIKSNQIVPFVGAGMSIDIYGSWGEAMQRMMKGYFDGLDSDANEIGKLIGGCEFENAAQKIYDALKKTAFHDRLVAMFKDSRITDEQLKKMTVRYLPKIFKNSLVVTTNFDKTLERAYLAERYAFDEKVVLRHLTAWQATRVRRGSLHYLIKIHGCVSAPDEVVITKESYDDLYKYGSEHMARLHSILSANSLLFVGCGLREDRTVDLLRGVSSDDHYAILPMNGDVGQEAFEKRRKFMSEDLHMHCIWYPKGEHHYVEDILEYIYADTTGQAKDFCSEPPFSVQNAADKYKPSNADPTLPDDKAMPPATVPQHPAELVIKNELFTFGRWRGKSLEWLVLEVQQDKALLIAKDCLFTAPYNEKQEIITWERCTLRDNLRNKLSNQIFNDVERNRVLPCTIKNPDNTQYETPGGADTVDNLFLLSIDEAMEYFPYNNARIARIDGEEVCWWLRSPGSYSIYAAFVYYGGDVLVDGDNIGWSGAAVRPAFWLSLKP